MHDHESWSKFFLKLMTFRFTMKLEKGHDSTLCSFWLSDIARVYTIHEYLHEKQVFQYIQLYTRTKISRGDDFHVFILTIIN